jgi:hypothetical protein
VSGVSHREFTHLVGLDVSKDSIAVAVLEPDRDQATVQKIFHDEVSVRRLIGRFDDRSRLWARQGRRAMTCIGCCSAWGCVAMSSRRR